MARHRNRHARNVPDCETLATDAQNLCCPSCCLSCELVLPKPYHAAAGSAAGAGFCRRAARAWRPYLAATAELLRVSHTTTVPCETTQMSLVGRKKEGKKETRGGNKGALVTGFPWSDAPHRNGFSNAQ